MPVYRLAPEHLFPAAFDDACAAYQHLLDTGIAASRIVLGGDSAGGGLALAVLAELLRKNMPLPAGVFALSPLTDTTFSGESVASNSDADVMLPAKRAREMIGMYLGEGRADDPRASPLFADFAGAPPIFLAVGTTEILRDDTLRLKQVLADAAVRIDLDLQHDVPHVWPLFRGLLPEAEDTLRRIGDWAKPLLKTATDS